MKRYSRIFRLMFTPCLLLALGATVASAQTPPIQHVIVIVQENRSIENLFNQDTALANNGGYVQPPNNSGNCHGTQIPLAAADLSGYCPGTPHGVFDPDHRHSPSWTNQWHSGAMDGACDNDPHITGTCSGLPTCSGGAYPHCAAYTYVNDVQLSGYHAGSHILDPYFNIAASYGFANWMFQTNQGPSFPAHQFLFSGTSAPDNKGDPLDFYQWFAAENPLLNGNSTPNTGCAAAQGTYVLEVDPTGAESKGYDPPEVTPAQGFPCYNHPTMANLLDGKGISWKYYTQGPTQNNTPAADIWTAPNAISAICLPLSGGQCNGTDWPKVILPGTPSTNTASPILNDLGATGSCNLPKVSWVIPDGFWSDHPGTNGADGGPGWVAAIVNAVGGVDNDDGPLPINCGYWQNTVILITWDDWGGFYDDVVPPNCGPGQSCGYLGGNNTGQQYVYGFRVPLMVVSAYAKQNYVSGPSSNPSCPNPYCHDFGSILNFIEHTFGILNPPGINGNVYAYADSTAMDASPTCLTCTYSLADFFDYTQQQRPFTYIQGANYPTQCYMDPYLDPYEGSNCFQHWPSEPDNDGIE